MQLTTVHFWLKLIKTFEWFCNGKNLRYLQIKVSENLTASKFNTKKVLL